MQAKDPFFDWKDRTKELTILEFTNSIDFTSRLVTSPNEISNFNFISQTLENFEINNLKNKFQEVTFKNAAFNQSTIKRITFNKCTFENCYFIATKFDECEFHHCNFV
ncbi:MAG TPA: pentapeptide repeat-containing protein, partial [Bacteroidia bacterium]